MQMSTQSKYGWAIALIVAGLVGALPFRHNAPSEKVARRSESEEKVSTGEEEQANNGSAVGKPNSTAGSGNRQPRPLSQSQLLPKSLPSNPKSTIPQFDSEVVEQVPGRLDKNQFAVVEPESSGVQPKSLGGGTPMPPGDQPETPQQPGADLSQIPQNVSPDDGVANQPIRKMPEDVGPYRMRPVNPSRFRSASQEGPANKITPASRTRKVVHYKLRDGDTLRSIAQRYLGDANRYQEILNDNRHLLTNGENFLPVGQYLTIVVD